MGEGTVDRLVTRFLRGISMPIDIKKLLETPALMFSEELTAARLKRAGVTLGEDLGLPTQIASKSGILSGLIRKLAVTPWHCTFAPCYVADSALVRIENDSGLGIWQRRSMSLVGLHAALLAEIQRAVKPRLGYMLTVRGVDRGGQRREQVSPRINDLLYGRIDKLSSP
jgi:hypothetical protein